MLLNARSRWGLMIAAFSWAQQPVVTNADLTKVAQEGFISGGSYENCGTPSHFCLVCRQLGS
jgi:hypothetical protein